MSATYYNMGSLDEGTPRGMDITVAGVPCYFTQPSAAAANGCAVILATDAFGYQRINARLIADAYSDAGYICVVPDYFQGEPLNMKLLEAFEAFKALPTQTFFGKIATWLQLPRHIVNLGWWFKHHPFGHAVDVLSAVAAELKQIYRVTKVGMQGYGYGGTVGILMASKPGVVDAVVSAHPGSVKLHEVDAICTPIMFICAESCAGFPEETRTAVQQVLDDKSPGLGKFILYPGTKHGFAVRGNKQDPAVNAARQDALEQSMHFFEQHLLSAATAAPAVPAITQLVVTDCSELQSLPFKALSTLTLLDFSGCSPLEGLPTSLSGKLPALRQLMLNGCRSLKQLPTTLDSLQLLTELHLRDCTSLVQLPDSVGNLLCLQLLDLTGCSSLQRLPDTVESLMDLRELRLAGCSKLVEPPSIIGRGTTRLDDNTVLPARYYTSAAGAAPSAADMAACLQQQQPQMVLIQPQHCQAAGLQESLAQAGYFELLKASTQGSIFATADVLLGLEGAISGQASSTRLDGSGSCVNSSSSALKGQQAEWKYGFGALFSWWRGQGADSGSGGSGGNGGNGEKDGTGQSSQDAGGSSSGGDEASSSKDDAAAALKAIHAACSGASCGNLKLGLLKQACASTLGQGGASCSSAHDGSTVMRVLEFRSVLNEGSKGLTSSAAWKLRDWPKQAMPSPSSLCAPPGAEHGFKVELALSMCRHDSQVCLKVHQAHAEHSIDNEEQRCAVRCLGLPLLRSSFALVGGSSSSDDSSDDADDTRPDPDNTIVYLKDCNISGPVCVEDAKPTQSKLKLEKYWLFGVEPKVTLGQKNVSLEAGIKAQQSLLPETKLKVESNVPEQLVMLHPAAPRPVYLDSTACGRANMELRRNLLKSVLCSEGQDRLCCLDYNPMLQRLTLPLLTYIADLGEDFSGSSLELHVDVCLPSVMVRVKNPWALDNSRIWGINLDKAAAVFLLEGRCQLKVDLK